MQHDSANRQRHASRDLQKSQSVLCDLSGRHVCPGQVSGSQFVQQDVREAGEQQSELVGRAVMAAGPIGEEHQLLFLDAVFLVGSLANRLRRTESVAGLPEWSR